MIRQILPHSTEEALRCTPELMAATFDYAFNFKALKQCLKVSVERGSVIAHSHHRVDDEREPGEPHAPETRRLRTSLDGKSRSYYAAGYDRVPYIVFGSVLLDHALDSSYAHRELRVMRHMYSYVPNKAVIMPKLFAQPAVFPAVDL